ncbi:hypothetical protein BV394_01615 [Brevirhabdus pacifica]|uniref:Uncharacterized protein n=1 Tax=Brevirhabdus pacifica TaxID=1267768 RepID=A0A1U7DF12_9RHOB|nr:DUF502 domain-containing protein [Brevirhabdus pacifica]APX88584.1 hypothetical protein BV394_01615 [Brevirhabdus pacifica]PJJ86926.1 putative membrane protein [Brevirhabdus pacifica]
MTSPNDLSPADPPKRRGPRAFARLRGNFLAGLIVVVPVALTLWLIWAVTGWIDSWVLPLVPAKLAPKQYIGVDLRGVGVVIFLIFTVIIGWLAKGIMGRSLLGLGESIVDRMPVVRSIYNGVKQLVETALSQGEASFDKAVLVQYPREGLWAIAFVSTPAKGEIAAKAPPEGELLSVFLPTTPNPTSGFLLFVPRSNVIFLDMSVEDAAKLVISAGLVYPNPKDPTKPSVPASSLGTQLTVDPYATK